MDIEWLPLGQSLADKHRAAELRWRGMPPGIPPEMAIEFMEKLKAGSTIRKLTGGGKNPAPAMVSYERFKKHCELNPKWGVEVWVISRKNVNFLKGIKKRAMTVCMRGHSLAHAPVRYDKRGYGHRECVECDRIYKGSIIKPAALIAVTAALENGASVNQVIRGFPLGCGPRNPKLQLTNVRSFYRHRRENPAFNSFVIECIQNRTWSATTAEPGTYRYDWDPDDARAIRAMIPEQFPGRDDVVQAIFLALFEGRLDRRQVEMRVRRFITGYYREHPGKFAKFGNSPLVSLDEVLFEDGTTTRGDTVSRGLWD